MDDERVDLLDPGGPARWDGDDVVGQLPGRARFCAGQRHRRRAAAAADLEAADDVRRLPARGDPDDEIARSSERLDLATEQVLVAEVVGDAGDDRRVDRQGDGAERSAVDGVPTDQLAGEALRV